MWKRMTVGAVAGTAWTVVAADAVGPVAALIDDGIGRLALGVGVVAMGRLMLWCQHRPLGDAYTLGFEAGQKEERRRSMRDLRTRGASTSSPRLTPARPISSMADRPKVDA